MVRVNLTFKTNDVCLSSCIFLACLYCSYTLTIINKLVNNILNILIVTF